MAFVSGYLALFLQGEQEASEADVMQISAIKSEFQKAVPPEIVVSLTSIYYGKGQLELLDPSDVITLKENLKSRVNYTSNQKCFHDFNKIINSKHMEKVWIWEEYRCRKRARLPRDFFVEGPYVHPSGYSYAYLALNSGREIYEKKYWVESHLPFFHALELKDVETRYGKLDDIFHVLATLNIQELISLSRGRGTILGKEFLLGRLIYPKIFNVLEYRVYSRFQLDQFLKNSEFSLTTFSPRKKCFYQDGVLCWNYSMKHMFSIANKSTLFLLFCLMIIITFVVRLLLTKLRNQKIEDEKRRLALRVLTHEFRTPITSMMLLMESMGKKSSSMSDELQEDYLNLSREVYRMKRLTETSRNYLKAENSKKLLNLSITKIEDLKEYVEELLFTFESDTEEGDIIVHSPDEKICVMSDPYWLKICLKNIIENALRHGKKPVNIYLDKKDDKVEISIVDQGESCFSSLDQMTEEFAKGPASEGTGLGMNIVSKVCQELGVKLCYINKPTTFILQFSKQGKNND